MDLVSKPLGLPTPGRSPGTVNLNQRQPLSTLMNTNNSYPTPDRKSVDRSLRGLKSPLYNRQRNASLFIKNGEL